MVNQSINRQSSESITISSVLLQSSPMSVHRRISLAVHVRAAGPGSAALLIAEKEALPLP